MRVDPRIHQTFKRMGCRVVKFTLGPAHRVGAKRLDPRFAWAYGNRGLAYKSKGMLAEALADLRLALALDPASPPARERLERLAATR